MQNGDENVMKVRVAARTSSAKKMLSTLTGCKTKGLLLPPSQNSGYYMKLKSLKAFFTVPGKKGVYLSANKQFEALSFFKSSPFYHFLRKI